MNEMHILAEGTNGYTVMPDSLQWYCNNWDEKNIIPIAEAWPNSDYDIPLHDPRALAQLDDPENESFHKGKWWGIE